MLSFESALYFDAGKYVTPVRRLAGIYNYVTGICDLRSGVRQRRAGTACGGRHHEDAMTEILLGIQDALAFLGLTVFVVLRFTHRHPA